MKRNSYDLDPRDVFLQGEVVALCVLTEKDVIESDWYGWFNDSDVCQNLQKHYFPNTIEKQREFLRAVNTSEKKIQLGIRVKGYSSLAGVISLNNIDHINRRAEISAIIGDRSARNPKVFLESCRLIFSHAFYTLNLNRVYGGSISKDLVKLMIRGLGCSSEGVGRQEVFKNGLYVDVYRYAILRADFELLNQGVVKT